MPPMSCSSIFHELLQHPAYFAGPKAAHGQHSATLAQSSQPPGMLLPLPVGGRPSNATLIAIASTLSWDQPFLRLRDPYINSLLLT